METNAAVFDATRPVAVQLRGPDGTKTVRVRFPSDDEWAERQRRRKVIVKQLGRGISETTIPNGEDIDAALLAKIRTEEEPEVDAFEAQKVIEQLATCDVDDVVLVGDAFRVALRVLGGAVTHLLKMPSAKDVNGYRRGFARVLDLPYGRQELTINVRAAGEHSTTFKDLHRTNLDGPAFNVWDFGRPLDGFIQILAVEQEESTQLLVGLGERSIGDQRLAISDAHSRRIGSGRESVTGKQYPGSFGIRQKVLPGLSDRTDFFRGEFWRHRLVRVHQQHVLHSFVLLAL